METKESKDDDIETGSVNSYIAGNNELKILGIRYFKNDFGCFPCVSKYSLNDFSTVYNTITHLRTLDNYQKNIVLVRFNRICHFINREYFLIKWCYTLSKLFVIMTGIIAPALLSINVQTGTFWYPYVYWLVWVIQLMVSLTTAFASFYKWDKKYFIYKAYKTKIEQELWLYLELIGRYGIINKKCPDEEKKSRTTHKTKLNLFLSRLEILFKRLKDADLDIEITEDDNQSKEGDNTKPTTIIGEIPNQEGKELVDPTTDGKTAEDLSGMLMTTPAQPMGSREASPQPLRKDAPRVVSPASSTTTANPHKKKQEVTINERDLRIQFEHLQNELRSQFADNQGLARSIHILEESLLEERRKTEKFRRESELAQVKMMNIVEHSKDLDSIILLQYAVRKFLKNKAKK